MFSKENIITGNTCSNNEISGIDIINDYDYNIIYNNTCNNNGKKDADLVYPTKDSLGTSVGYLLGISLIISIILIILGVKAGKKVLVYFIPTYIFWMILTISSSTALIIKKKDVPLPHLNLMGLIIISWVVLGILGLALQVLMIIDCGKREFIKEYKRVIWIVLLLQFGFIASIVYYYFRGRKPLKNDV